VPAFFERFREEIARYAEGVHQLGGPASATAVEGLPGELAAFLRSWDGAELFVDAVRVAPAAEVVREGELWIFGATAAGDRLAIDGRTGAVLRVEEDTGEPLVEGSSFARWIEGYVVAEAVVYDREGEFREGAFDEDGEELSAAAAEKRERKALKVDPRAPAPAWRLARALARLGKTDKARAVLAELTAREPGFGWAWFDLAKIERDAGRLAEAEAAYARAAEADPGYEHAGYFAAQAARAAAARGDEAARARHAARALELDAELPRLQREAAERLVAEGRRDEAREAAEVVKAVRPGDLQAAALLGQLGRD
jgi:tetratricopeptide (TPR) repeat protein